MSGIDYLKWLSNETSSCWWHDSADPDELEASLANGAVGVTTNPLLIKLSLYSRPDIWGPLLSGMPAGLGHAEKAEEIQKRITKDLAARLAPIYFGSGRKQGFVCAQVDPTKAGDTASMISMARRLHGWAPNIAVKLPVTAAGLDALEECTADGLTVTATASFTVPQVIAVAERYRKGLQRAKAGNIVPGRCFAVVMVGRLDDYLRDVAMDRKAAATESDIIQAGTATAKRAYSIFKERGYEAVIMPAGMRGTYHAAELAGADMVMSIHPKIQAMIEIADVPREERIDIPVEKDVIERLLTISEFVRAYEPDGMRPEEFITYGVTQRTLSQFVEAGWLPLGSYLLK
jgi:transaldolase